MKLTKETKRDICDCVQQCQYDFDDLRSHLRQLRFSVSHLSSQTNTWDSLRSFELELLAQSDQLSRDAKLFGCYVNCTTRWIAAGSSLQSFPADANAIQQMHQRLLREYLTVRISCKKCATAMVAHDLIDAAKGFVEAGDLLTQQMFCLTTASLDMI